MSDKNNSQQGNTARPTAKGLWHYALRAYANAKNALLEAQDQAGADVNLCLLYAYLDTLNLCPTPESETALMTVSARYQAHLVPMRAHRRKLKGQSGYEAALNAELDGEKEEQEALIAAIETTDIDDKAPGNLREYLDRLAIADTDLGNAILQSLSSA